MFFPLWKLLFVFHVACGFVSPSFSGKRRHLSNVFHEERFYCERSVHFPSVEDLVFYYGDCDNWWGDLGVRETRLLYHSLLPVYSLQYVGCNCSIEMVAFNSYLTRKAAKQYARRRSRAHVRVFSLVFDLFHNLWEHKKWRPTGPTFDELWCKYKNQLLHNDPEMTPETLNRTIAMLIAYKSCRTNKRIDRVVAA